MKIETCGKWVEMFLLEWNGKVSIFKVSVLSENIDRFQSVVFVKKLEDVLGQWRYGSKIVDFENPLSGTNTGNTSRYLESTFDRALARAKDLTTRRVTSLESWLDDAKTEQLKINNLSQLIVSGQEESA